MVDFTLTPRQQELREIAREYAMNIEPLLGELNQAIAANPV